MLDPLVIRKRVEQMMMALLEPARKKREKNMSVKKVLIWQRALKRDTFSRIVFVCVSCRQLN